MNIGQKIRSYRELLGLSLTQLSQLTNLSVGYLSQLERDIANPSLNSLKKIGDALGVKVSFFLSEDDDENLLESKFVVRANNRKKLTYSDPRVEVFILTPNNGSEIELLLIVAQPGAKKMPEDLFTHGKEEEAGFIIDGTMSLELNGHTFVLEKGDSIQFRSDLPHKWENVGPDVIVAVWAITSKFNNK